MVAHASQDDLSGYSAFNLHKTVYKTIQSHDLDLDVLLPKNFGPAPNGAPVILRFHGGGLICGASLTPLFFPQHLLDLATERSAIIVSPNYRLLPESTPNDILADTEDSWQWLHSSLGPFLRKLDPKTTPKTTPNLNQVLLYGESAGGYVSLSYPYPYPYLQQQSPQKPIPRTLPINLHHPTLNCALTTPTQLALQLALAHPNSIRALALAYPMVDLKSPWFSTSYHKQILTFPQSPRTALDEHLASSSPDSICTSDLTLARFTLMLITIQHGLYPLFFPANETALFPLERLAKGERLPKGGVLVLHGKGDSVVPVEHSRTLRDAVLAQQQEESEGVGEGKEASGKFTLVERDGEHGFDGELKLAEEEWLCEAWAPLVRVWLE